jgi:hypothetical protein
MTANSLIPKIVLLQCIDLQIPLACRVALLAASWLPSGGLCGSWARVRRSGSAIELN